MHLKGVFVPVLYQKDSVPGATAVTALMIKTFTSSLLFTVLSPHAIPLSPGIPPKLLFSWYSSQGLC